MRVLGAQNTKDSSGTSLGAKSSGYCEVYFSGFAGGSFNTKPKVFAQDSENTSSRYTHSYM